VALFALITSAVLNPMLASDGIEAPTGNNYDTLVLDYKFADPVATECGAYDLVTISGVGRYRRAGAPLIPKKGAVVLIPYHYCPVISRIASTG
jgi:hypothetical protein